ncbi:MAG: choice-of-anchor D domain-containing protein [Betaproteobacteria bacterium]|nr:choice-of-anchor D domain-containing protein [Betaproteobacteria bacterium]
MKNRLHKLLFRLFAASVLTGFSAVSHAVVCQFIPASGQWDLPANWANCTGGNGLPANTPGTADRAEVVGKTAILPAGSFSVGDVYLGAAVIQGAGIANTTLNVVAAGTIAWGSGAYTFQNLTAVFTSTLTIPAANGPLTVDNSQLVLTAPLTTMLADTITVTGAGAKIINGGVFNPSTSLTMIGGGVFENGPAAAFSAVSPITISGAFLNQGGFFANPGAAVTLNNAAAFTQTGTQAFIAGNGAILAAGQTLTLAAGFVDGNPTFSLGTLVNSGATLRPGGAGTIGTITINGNYEQQQITPTQYGSMEFDLASLVSVDQIIVSGSVLLAGNIGRGAIGTFAPPVGTVLDVLTAGSVSGGFNGGTELIVFDAPRRYAELISATKVSLRAIETVWVIGSTDDISTTLPSLRNAITRFNAESLSGCINAPYRIDFFLGTGDTTVQPASPLPAISGCPGLQIEGYSQAGSQANSSSDWNAVLPLTLDGATCSGCNGITIDAANTEVKGINFTNWDTGIRVLANGANAKINGNYFFQGAVGVSHDGGSNVLIGGGTFAERNVFVHATLAGIRSVVPGVHVQGNYVGVGSALTPGPNAYGILFNGSTSAIVDVNTIAYNTKGVVVAAGSGIDIVANSIFGNTSIGVDLGDDGPTANDPLDSDAGPNGLLNYPVITSANIVGNNLVIDYTLDTTLSTSFNVYSCANNPPGPQDQCIQFLGGTSGSIGAAPGFSGTHTVSISANDLIFPATLTMYTQVAGATSELSPGFLVAAPAVSLSANPIVLAPTPLNWTRALFVSATNSTAAPITFTPPTLTGATEFSVGVNQVPNCISGTIPANGQCDFIFNFTPSAQISYTGNFSLVTSAGNLSAPISGTGIASIAFPTVTPPTVNFLSTAVGSISSPQVVTFASPAGGATVQFQDLGGIGGTDPADFNLLTDGCTKQFVAAGANCTLQARFTPQATLGVKAAGLNYLAVEPSGSFRSIGVAFTGTATAAAGPVITITGTTSFPNTTVGASSALQSITITNSGGATLSLNSITHNNASIFPDTTSGPAPNAAHWCGFGSVAGGAPNTGSPINIAPGGTCVLNLIFAPNATGALSGTITINSNAPTTPTLIALTGTGLAAATPTMTVSFAPASVTTGANATMLITLANPSAGPALISSGAVTIPTNLNFAAIGTNTCGAAPSQSVSVFSFSTGTIPALGNCTFSVPVNSTVTGSYVVNIPANALVTGAGTSSNTSSATLTVTAVPAPIVTSAATASGTVGTAFTYQILATNTPVSFGATGLPAGLGVNAGTGQIAGTPSAAGTFAATVSATNASGTGSQGLSITIAAAATPSMSVSFAPASVLPGVNALMTLTLSNTDVSSAFISSGSVNIPAGLTATAPATNTCGTFGSVGGGVYSFGMGFVPASGSCTIDITVQSATPAPTPQPSIPAH